jgi:hypothetical protein
LALDGAKGLGNYDISIGSGASSTAASTIAIGLDAVINSGATGYSNSAICIGTSARVGSVVPADGVPNAICIGHAAIVDEEGGVAIGWEAKVTGGGMAVGDVAIGYQAEVGAQGGIAIGPTSYTDNGIAIGWNANTGTGGDNVAIGRLATVTGASSSSTVVGVGAGSTGTGGTAIGLQSSSALRGTSLGNAAGAGVDAVACGAGAVAGANSVACGRGAVAAQTGAQAYGNSATTTSNNEVMFGSASVAIAVFRAISTLAANPDLFRFDGPSILANNQSSMWLLIQGSGGALALKQVTLTAPVMGFSTLQVANP